MSRTDHGTGVGPSDGGEEGICHRSCRVQTPGHTSVVRVEIVMDCIPDNNPQNSSQLFACCLSVVHFCPVSDEHSPLLISRSPRSVSSLEVVTF